MGTEMYKSCLPGYHSMRDLNENSNGSSWPLFCGDKTLTNGQYYNGFLPRTATDAYPGCDIETLKQKMLEHEAIFKNQVYELHRLYRIQRDMMEEIKRKELHKHQMSNEALSSSSRLAFQIPTDEAWKWQIPGFQLPSVGYTRKLELGANSPMGLTTGNNTQAYRTLPQNGCTPKDCELLESRPSKVRKKLFDLHLPADEYIDGEEGEQFQANKISDRPRFPSINHKSTPEDSANWLSGGAGKISCQRDASTSHSRLKSSIGFADLNEPIQVDETVASTSAEFLSQNTCHGEIRGLELSSRPKTESLVCPEGMGWNSHGSNNGSLHHLFVDRKGNDKECFSYADGAAHNKPELKPVAHRLQQSGKLSVPPHSTHAMLNKAHQSSVVLLSDRVREDICRERIDYLHYKKVEPVTGSCIASSYPSLSSSDFGNSWSPSSLAWGKPSNSLSQMFTEANTHLPFNSIVPLSGTSQSSSQSHGIFGEMWHVNGTYGYNPGLSNLPKQNGLHYGSYSGSKEPSASMPSNGYNLLNCNRNDNGASEHSIIHGSEKFSKSPTSVDLKPAKDMNSNMVLLKSSFGETFSEQDLEIIAVKDKLDDHTPVLPWLRVKPSCKNEAVDTGKDSNTHGLDFFLVSSNPLLSKRGHWKDFHSTFTKNAMSASSSHDIEAKTERTETLSTQKILGFPILEAASTKESKLYVSTSSSLDHPPSGQNIRNKGKNRLIDINVACDSSLPDSSKKIDAEAPVTGKVVDTKTSSFRNQIDLNSCINEEEYPSPPSIEGDHARAKIALEIDLEAPVIHECEEDAPLMEENGRYEDPLQSQLNKTRQPEDDVVSIAAEAILAMSSASHNHAEDMTCHSSDATLADPLLWFVEIVSSCADNVENKWDKESGGRDAKDIDNSFSKEIDYFEAMTLQITETKSEDYMPKPFVPEFQKEEETATTSLPNRARRGPARRGRQRRDFQRDILPGLASLSRHEVTEDLQTFGELMRATGHPWNSGITRRNGTRNGARRGKRKTVVELAPEVMTSPPCSSPLVQQHNNMEVELEDRSITAWGKTPRRTRRQRCPVGNPPAPLT